MSATYQDRPIVDGREQRYRFELRRVDEQRRVYVFLHDLRTYSEAVLYADVAATMMPALDFVVWDSVLGRALHETKKKRPPPREEAPAASSLG